MVNLFKTEFVWEKDYCGLFDYLNSHKDENTHIGDLISSAYNFSAKNYGKSHIIWGGQTQENTLYFNTLKAQFPKSKIILAL